jgi:hypothetical protein
MSEIHEAPIQHGTISVGTFSSKNITLASSSFNAIDIALDSSSQNPLSNSVTKSSLELTSPPDVSAFTLKLETKSIKSSTGHVSFDYVAHEMNTFGSGGEANGTIEVPASGTYLITSNSRSTIQSNNLNMSLKVNSVDVSNVSKDGVLVILSVIFLNNGDVISVHSNNTTPLQTTLEMTLIKPSQVI